MSVRAAILLEQRTRTKGKSRTEIQQLIGESNSEILSVESQIADLESRLASLVERRDREILVVDALRHLISPIQLPVELLVRIFGFAISKEQHLGRYAHFQDAYRVSHVSSHWRAISFGTPRLWTGPVGVDLRVDGDADGLKAWLSRSAPMSVPILLTEFPEEDVAHRVLEELLSISSRWSSLCLYRSAPAWFFMRLAVGHTFESLEEVDLGPSHVDGTSALPIFGATPLLRKLSFTPTSRLNMPWTQLRDLTLRTSTATDISLEILAQCVNLVTASVDTFMWTLVAPSRMVTLPHLRIFEIDGGYETHFMSFLDSLSAPALTSLVLYFGSRCPWSASAFTAFQLRSPHLTSLKLCHAFLTPDALIAALLYAPLLNYLTLDFCMDCIDDALLRALHYERGLKPLVPRLRDLRLRGISPTRVSENILAGLIASRWWTDAEEESGTAPADIARWERVELRVETPSAPFSESFEDIIENLKRSGLHTKQELRTEGEPGSRSHIYGIVFLARI
ncbi:hypothetical protein B0H16DRAFT_1885621 [Mycena metata]|uniref:F-box domain-containing protein n=1 Tax=Mycena metata TaxID=1033252 RepID=A0AAD7NFG2_9AGAR|nr:hypothetical protein B0H16DRAFT_1885621 [Mycena metata]